MNKTKIEWADYTWNPVTGCLHGCPYCYARDIANRFHEPDTPPEERFRPRFHPEKLEEPSKLKKPSCIFVVSMGDLFGNWAPLSWIRDVFDACAAAPWHQYIFLTKNPQMYNKLCHMALLPIGINYWYGATVTRQEDLDRARRKNSFQTWWSVEPLLGPLKLSVPADPRQDFSNLHPFQYPRAVIVGAETGRRPDRVTPEREWVEDIRRFCETDHFWQNDQIPIFYKDNLRGLFPYLPPSDMLPWQSAVQRERQRRKLELARVVGEETP